MTGLAILVLSECMHSLSGLLVFIIFNIYTPTFYRETLNHILIFFILNYSHPLSPLPHFSLCKQIKQTKCSNQCQSDGLTARAYILHGNLLSFPQFQQCVSTK